MLNSCSSRWLSLSIALRAVDQMWTPASILFYIFGKWFTVEFLKIFVTIIFMISIDFWIVKNITGRLLAGLRWWNHIDENGESFWIFENRHKTKTKDLFDEEDIVPESTQIVQSRSDKSSSDSIVFWISLFIFTFFWIAALFSSIFSLNVHWMLLVLIALILNCSNLYGYIRCKFGNNFNYNSFVGSYVTPRVFSNMMGFVKRDETANVS
ncbi:sodium-coupled monocarboxylate transporter 1-like [Sarcoptes scabiei]|nr:sodium-coupled monocarboxylate transporter 1-like [Sarcoptes scabiei]